jgi:hypothetical protein
MLGSTGKMREIRIEISGTPKNENHAKISETARIPRLCRKQNAFTVRRIHRHLSRYKTPALTDNSSARDQRLRPQQEDVERESNWYHQEN